MRLLVADAGGEMPGRVRSLLERWKFAVDVASSRRAAVERLLGGTYDIAIVDAALPDGDGMPVAMNVRQHGVRTLVIVVSAMDRVADRVSAFENGADAYLAKPFTDAELIARVNSLARRTLMTASHEVVMKLGGLKIDAAAHLASFAGRPLPLSATEFRLLLFLVRNAGMTLTRRQILRQVWRREFDEPTNVVDVYVGSLRKKLTGAGGGDVIKTVYKSGWSLCG
jgi:DNA-binding response OmpR family regulator